MNRTRSDGFWSDCLFLFFFFRAVAARTAADWVTVLKQSCCCLIWQQLSLCVHLGALQIEFRNHKNTFLSQFHCLSFSISQIFHSAHICFSPPLSFSFFFNQTPCMKCVFVFLFWSFYSAHCHLSLHLIIKISSSIPSVSPKLHKLHSILVIDRAVFSSFWSLPSLHDLFFHLFL